MASSKEYLDYILGQLSSVPEISYRPMMGEYIIYCKDKVIGGIYDDRFLLKPTTSALKIVPQPAYSLPYEGAKEMLAADIDDRMLMEKLIPAIAEDLPVKGKRKK